jgi:hypothetical protein
VRNRLETISRRITHPASSAPGADLLAQP